MILKKAHRVDFLHATGAEWEGVRAQWQVREGRIVQQAVDDDLTTTAFPANIT